MFRKLIIFTALIIVSLGSMAEGKMKDFRLKDLDNNAVRYSQLKGAKLTIIDFWATWCKPCARAIPKMNELYERYQKQGVQLIGISVDSPRNLPKVKPFVRSKRITYPVLLDLNSQLMADLKIKQLPTILFVDSNDEIIFFHQGYRPGDEKVLEKEIQKILANTKVDNDEG